MSASRPVPAVLQTAAETETGFGGRDQTWTSVATLWIALSVGSPGQALDGAAASPAETDAATAAGRDHPLAAQGQRLLIGDDADPWMVRRVDRGVPRPGRMTLRLDRLL